MGRSARVNVGDLRTKYAEVIGEETNSRNKVQLFQQIAWQVQALAEGGLSERAKRRAAELARESDVRPRNRHLLTPGQPPAGATRSVPVGPVRDPRVSGTVLVRDYKDQSACRGARVTQVMDLLYLAPDIQESILSWESEGPRRDHPRHHRLLGLASETPWMQPRMKWDALVAAARNRTGGSAASRSSTRAATTPPSWPATAFTAAPANLGSARNPGG